MWHGNAVTDHENPATIERSTGSLSMRMLRVIVAIAFAILAAPVRAQRPGNAAAPDGLLDEMTGHWVLTGTIGGKPTTHDVDVDWILKGYGPGSLRAAW